MEVSLECLRGQRVLLVEDEPMVAIMLEDMMADLGVEVVATAMTLKDAQQAASLDGLDAAILDINLKGEMSYPAGEILVRRGIPMILVTGYARHDPPQSLARVPIIPKPYRVEQIARALAQVVAPRTFV